MTEKEKMLRQMLYDANNDTNLIEERKAAKDLCYDFNHLRPSDTIGQQRIMRRLLGKTAGDSFSIVAPSGATMATISRLARTSLPTTTR